MEAQLGKGTEKGDLGSRREETARFIFWSSKETKPSGIANFLETFALEIPAEGWKLP